MRVKSVVVIVNTMHVNVIESKRAGTPAQTVNTLMINQLMALVVGVIGQSFITCLYFKTEE